MPCDGSRVNGAAQIVRFFFAIYRTFSAFAREVLAATNGSSPAQINLEIHKRVIFFERAYIRDIKMCRVEQIELVL